jgi:hypothetical protein
LRYRHIFRGGGGTESSRRRDNLKEPGSSAGS